MANVVRYQGYDDALEDVIYAVGMQQPWSAEYMASRRALLDEAWYSWVACLSWDGVLADDYPWGE